MATATLDRTVPERSITVRRPDLELTLRPLPNLEEDDRGQQCDEACGQHRMIDEVFGQLAH